MQLSQNLKWIILKCNFGLKKNGTKYLVRRYQAKFAKKCSRVFEGMSILAYKIPKETYVRLYFLFSM